MMGNGKTTFFYALLIAVASLAVGMVLASRLDLSPTSSAQTLDAPPMNSSPIGGPIDATTFRQIAKEVTPTVVNIRTETMQRTRGADDPTGDLLERFFGVPPQRSPQRERPISSRGTGFIVDKTGFIITNNHVVEGTTRIRVSLYGEDEDYEYDARVIGRDPLTDSALIELTEKPDHELPVVRFGDSSLMEPGDWVMAIGNPFGLAHTVSVGVISGNRPGSLPVSAGRAATVLQTDAAINPGNSGGPLLNVRGEVIGINTAILADPVLGQGGNIGIGFAIPSNAVRAILPQLRTGKVTRGRLGVGLMIGGVPRDAVEQLGLRERRGAVIETVEPGSAAERAGLQIGDVIISYDNRPVRGNDELVEMVMGTTPGTNVPVTIVRNRQERTLTVAPEELDLDAEQAAAQRPARPDAAPPQERTSEEFGMTLRDISPQIARELNLDTGTQGALVTSVQRESPAERARIRPRDVIIRIGDTPVTSVADVERLLAEVPERGTVFVRVLSDSQSGYQERFVILSRE